MMEATRTFKRRTRKEVVVWLQKARERKQSWEEQIRREEEELKMEVERAKHDPFYQRSTDGLACEPAIMPQPIFRSGSFKNAIGKQRIYQKEWQKRINRELDEREEQRRIAMERLQ